MWNVVKVAHAFREDFVEVIKERLADRKLEIHAADVVQDSNRDYSWLTTKLPSGIDLEIQVAALERGSRLAEGWGNVTIHIQMNQETGLSLVYPLDARGLTRAAEEVPSMVTYLEGVVIETKAHNDSFPILQTHLPSLPAVIVDRVEQQSLEIDKQSISYNLIKSELQIPKDVFGDTEFIIKLEKGRFVLRQYLPISGISGMGALTTSTLEELLKLSKTLDTLSPEILRKKQGLALPEAAPNPAEVDVDLV